MEEEDEEEVPHLLVPGHAPGCLIWACRYTAGRILEVYPKRDLTVKCKILIYEAPKKPIGENVD